MSDASGLLASPHSVLRGASLRAQWDALVSLITGVVDADDGLAAIVVGVPKRLDGSATDMTAQAEGLAARLGRTFPVPIVTLDERLTSVEAEQRLAHTERDWRKRKDRIDAAAAAILLQEFLDSRELERLPGARDAAAPRGPIPEDSE